jgi:hypothetical protein
MTTVCLTCFGYSMCEVLIIGTIQYICFALMPCLLPILRNFNVET